MLFRDIECYFVILVLFCDIECYFVILVLFRDTVGGLCDWLGGCVTGCVLEGVFSVLAV